MRHDLVRSFIFALVVAASLTTITGCRRRPFVGDGGPIPTDGGPTGRILSCTPGQTLWVGCDSTVGLPCMGDPTISVCAGPLDPASCSSSSPMPPLLAYDDDGGDGLCPRATITCPASGSLAVQARPYGSSTTWVCDFGIAPAPAP
jgi:hypothetical protein